MKRFGKRTVVVLAVAVAASVAAVAGYAFWTSTGTGSGYGEHRHARGVAGHQPGTEQAPRSCPVARRRRFSTPSRTPARAIRSSAGVTVSVANANGSAWTPVGGCSAADFSVNGQAAGSPHFHTALAQTFGPGGSSSATVSVRLVETGANQNGCQGVNGAPVLRRRLGGTRTVERRPAAPSLHRELSDTRTRVIDSREGRGR